MTTKGDFDGKEVDILGFIIMLGVIAITITSLSIEVKLKGISEQNKEIIDLLKQIKEK